MVEVLASCSPMLFWLVKTSQINLSTRLPFQADPTPGFWRTLALVVFLVHEKSSVSHLGTYYGQQWCFVLSPFCLGFEFSFGVFYVVIIPSCCFNGRSLWFLVSVFGFCGIGDWSHPNWPMVEKHFLPADLCFTVVANLHGLGCCPHNVDTRPG